MALFPPTPNMGLELPQPANATNPQPGPLWASDLNEAFTVIDTHDHTTGMGTRVPVAGLNINEDLQMVSSGTHYGVGVASYYGYFAQGASAGAVTAPNGTTFVTAVGDLYYRSTSGANILISSASGLASTGTGEYNGFYGQYATGSPLAANAVAYFNNTTKTYEFNLSVPTTPVGYTNLARVYGKSFVTVSGGVTAEGFLAPDSTRMTYPSVPKGGWGIRPVNSGGGTFAIAWDTTDNGATYPGTYLGYAFSIGSSSLTPLPMQFRMGLNIPSAVGSPGVRALPQYPLDMNWWDATTSGPQNLGAFTAYSSGAPAAGFGPRLNFLAASTAWVPAGTGSIQTVNAVASSAQGALDGFWQTVATRAGGLRLRGAYGGSYSATAGVEIVNLAGTGDSIGLGGAALSTALVTTYGTIAPNTDNTITLGRTGVQFASVFTRSVTAETAALALTGGTIGLNGNTTVTGTLASTSTVQGTYMIPTSAPTAGVAGVGGSYKNNQVLAWGKVDANGGAPVLTADFGVTSITLVSSVNFAYYTINLDRAVSSDAVVLVTGAMPADAATGVQFASASFSGASQITVSTARSSGTSIQSSTDIDFNFIIIGSPA